MKIAIIGGGPAGLRAAESTAEALRELCENTGANRAEITLFDAKPSVGRKFLVAGKGGLNITKDEPLPLFETRYLAPGAPAMLWPSLLAEFTPEGLREWASGLGVSTFVASTRRVYPEGMKAAPLLRRWVARLKEHGVAFVMNHRWSDWKSAPEAGGAPEGTPNPHRPRYQLTFETPSGPRHFEADAVILALGGGSWPQTGCDGRWLPLFTEPSCGGPALAVAPFQSANCGWEVAWSPAFLARCEGMPLKNIVASAAGKTRTEGIPGELMITRYGLEGGALYQLGPQLRASGTDGTDGAPELLLDLKPSASALKLLAQLGALPKTLPPTFLADAAKRWKLGEVGLALLQEQLERQNEVAYPSAEALIAAVKQHRLPLLRPRPLAEAISTAGGLCWSEIDASLMLHKRPGVFVAGEMIDWEAPTGGYLMQGAFATGHRAGRSAVRYLLG